jgi:hypothetical protein
METESPAVQHQLTDEVSILDGIAGRLLHSIERDEYIGLVVANALGEFLDESN